MTILLFNMSESFAAGSAKCDQFVKASDAAYTMVHGHPMCGLDPNDPRWKFPPSQDSEYRRFCAKAADDTIDQLTQQIIDANTRCRVCSARLEQCEAQDSMARIYHCGALKSENRVCADFETNPPTMVYQCVSGWFMLRGLWIHYLEPSERQELTDRNRELDQCRAEKRNQIDFCTNYVDQTRKLARTVDRACDKVFSTDRRFSPNDDDRMEWCMGLSQSPAGDPNFSIGNIDSITFLRDALKACQGKKVLTAPEAVGRRK
jgi:hypothetical protein